jgi:hypothetical protein
VELPFSKIISKNGASPPRFNFFTGDPGEDRQPGRGETGGERGSRVFLGNNLIHWKFSLNSGSLLVWYLSQGLCITAGKYLIFAGDFPFVVIS